MIHDRIHRRGYSTLENISLVKSLFLLYMYRCIWIIFMDICVLFRVISWISCSWSWKSKWKTSNLIGLQSWSLSNFWITLILVHARFTMYLIPAQCSASLPKRKVKNKIYRFHKQNVMFSTIGTIKYASNKELDSSWPSLSWCKSTHSQRKEQNLKLCLKINMQNYISNLTRNLKFTWIISSLTCH